MFRLQQLFFTFVLVSLKSANPTPLVLEIGYVASFEKIGGSIEINPFPAPTVVKSIHLERVKIEDSLLREMLSNCLQVEVFYFKPDISDSTFDLSIVNQMPHHEFSVFILDSVTVDFSKLIAPINAYLQVTFYESVLPSDFNKQLQTWFPIINTMNVVEAQFNGTQEDEKGLGVGWKQLEFFLSGQIPTLRHLYIRKFDWDHEPERLRTIFQQLGCPRVTDYVFLDKDYDVWEC